MSDYSTLAQRVSSSVSGIRGCLLLSRDGLVLGAHPQGKAESKLKTAWVRFASIGDPDRSYVEFPDQIWAFVRRGSYAAFAVADVGVRPGVLMDLLEQALMAGEQERVLERDTLRLPEAPSAPSGKPRTSMHKPDRVPSTTAESAEVTLPASEYGAEQVVASDEDRDEATSVVGTDHPPEDAAEAASDAEPDPGSEPTRPVADEEEESEVDRILLAKEFAGLLQVPKEDDEASG